MSASLGFQDSEVNSPKQNFYYHSNIEIDEELERNLNYSGFSSSDYEFDFSIESSIPLIVKLDDHIIEIETIENLKELLHFKRELARVLKLNSSMASANLDEMEVAGLYLEKVYQDNDDNFIPELFKISEIKNEFNIKVIDKADSHLYPVKEDYCFEDTASYYLLTVKGEKEEAQKAALAIANVIQLINANEEELSSEQLGVTDLINNLTYPVVIISDDGIVHYHNDHFLKLGITPNNLIKNLESGWIDIDDQKYKILSSTTSNLRTICLVKQEFNYTKSHSELGIITSSIAHELNNPLAGILAAINMLELEEWEEDDLTILNEMKASTNRCKSLINTFLGFAKVNDQLSRQSTFESILQQAISLLSNRKIESGISIQTNISNDLKEHAISGASLPIILYLILSEMMTLKNHELLIDASSNSIDCNFYRSEHDIILTVKNLNIEGQKSKILNRLIIHLLALENSRVEIHGQDIVVYNLV
ncbi:histidine kinase dimerization/phospho-acceptor domain-containing protein [Halobacteriovorax sp. ZH4_bin.1]|uniref:histidine kinase dimerization/phospho-acceptor domain-containing protein n=1 Tax=unclassified Halobacteriovorax TaxID=2639665 RepID=UPI003723F63F